MSSDDNTPMTPNNAESFTVADSGEGQPQPAEGTVVAPDNAVGSDVPSEENLGDGYSGERKEVTDDVVSDLLQGKYSTDAAEQRRRLSEAGYDPEEVVAAVQKRLALRYQ